MPDANAPGPPPNQQPNGLSFPDPGTQAPRQRSPHRRRSAKPMEWPNRLAELRFGQRLTQEQVATASGISRVVYSTLEQGRRRMTLAEEGQLAKIYAITPSSLYGPAGRPTVSQVQTVDPDTHRVTTATRRKPAPSLPAAIDVQAALINIALKLPKRRQRLALALLDVLANTED